MCNTYYTCDLEHVYYLQMEKLVLDGKTYVLASKAADSAGYTRDYVGQLARSGKIEAHLVGRSWYVNIDQLGDYRVETKRNSRIKAREQVRKSLRVREEELSEKESRHYLERAASYEKDSTELMPEVRRVPITLEKEKVTERKKRSNLSTLRQKKEPTYTVENEGDKVLMSGNLDIVDATDAESVDEDTIFLQARLEKKKKKISQKTKTRASEKINKLGVKNSNDSEEYYVDLSEKSTEKTDFLTKLQERLNVDAETAEENGDSYSTPDDFAPEKSKTRTKTASGPALITYFAILLALILAFLLVTFETSLQYLDMDTTEEGSFFKSKLQLDITFFK